MKNTYGQDNTNTYLAAFTPIALLNGHISMHEEYWRHIFINVYAKHHTSLQKQAYAFTRSRQDAEDIVQDIYVKLWQQRPQLASVENIEGWLYRVVRNRCIDYCRRRQLQKLNCDPLTQDQQVTKPTADLHRVFTQAESRLSPRQLQVFRMYQYQGLEKKQIAKICSLSLSTVKQHLMHSERALRAVLAG